MKWKNRIKGVAIGLAITIGWMPLAAIITLLSGSFWLWFENTFAIEAFGHSGPAAWGYLVAITAAIWSYLSKPASDQEPVL